MNQSNDPPAYDDTVASFRKTVRNGYEGASDPKVVAEAVLKAVNNSSPNARYAVGSQARMSITIRHLLSDGLFDRVVDMMYR